MGTQINLRLSDAMIAKVREHASKNGFGNIQEFIQETVRQRLYGSSEITPEELALAQKILKATNEKSAWGTEKSIISALRRKADGVRASGFTGIQKATGRLKR